MKEEFLFSNTLSATIIVAEIKALVDSFFEANVLSLHNFKHIRTDGAPAMIGVKSRFVTLVKNQLTHVTSSHCSLHRYTLASKTLPLYLVKVIDVAIKVINFIRLRAKKSPALSTFGQRNGSATCGTFVFYQSPLAEANASLGCIN